MKLSNLILENVEAELEDAFDDLEKEIKQTDLDAPESEAIGLTLAGVALSFGEISKLLAFSVSTSKSTLVAVKALIPERLKNSLS